MQISRVLKKSIQSCLSGKAIYLGIIISFIATIFAFQFILSRYYEKIGHSRMNMKIILGDHSISAINILMQYKLEHELPQDILSYVNDTLIHLQSNTSRWGVYGIASASLSWKDIKITRTSLFGNKLSDESITGLYLANHGNYLALAGDSYLSGTCFLPELGVRKTYFNNEPFKYSKLVNGPTIKSKKELPALASGLTNYLKNILIENNDDSLISEDILYSKEYIRSFQKSAVRLKSDSEITLEDITLKGHIIVQSETNILISADAKLEDIICIAPNIYLQKGFEGCVQLIASDTLVLGENVRLHYPSSAIIAGFGRSNSFLQVQEETIIEGTVLNFTELLKGKNAFTDLAEMSTIFGVHYTSGKTQHKGKIIGSLYTDKLIIRNSQGTFENQLYNAWVDPFSLQKEFSSGILLENSENIRNVIKWVQ